MNSKRFENKVTVITGGNSGIGLATAMAYAQEGAKVVISGRDDKSLQAAVQKIGPGALAIRADVSKLADIEKMIGEIKAKFGRIDALFVNAGIAKFVPFEQVTESFYDETMAINVKGSFFTVQKAVPLMAAGSAIVLNGSINAHMGMPNTTVYAPSKAAIVNLAKTLSADLVSRGIRVNVISPGPIETPIISRMGMPAEAEKQTKDWIVSQVPLKRFGTSEEIAAAVLFLTSSDSSFTIGSELIIDGGMVNL